MHLEIHKLYEKTKDCIKDEKINDEDLILMKISFDDGYKDGNLSEKLNEKCLTPLVLMIGITALLIRLFR